MKAIILKNQKKDRRKNKIRAKISGTSERPRLSVFRSLKHIQLQLIDDVKHKTLISAVDTEIKDVKKTKTELSFELAKNFAKKVIDKNIKEIVFDRGGNRYHGRVKAVADGLRDGGLKF